MDANELSNLLEDVREFMTLVRTGERAFINQVTEVARENTAAHSPIGHVIEQYLLKVRLNLHLACSCLYPGN